MLTSTFCTEHCHDACDRADHPKQNMNADNCQKDRRRGWDGNASNDCHAVAHPYPRLDLFIPTCAAAAHARQSHLPTATASSIPASCATMNKPWVGTTVPAIARGR